MDQPTQRMTFRDDQLEQEVRAELLCRVPPELTARLLALVPHHESVFHATPRQRRATLWLIGVLVIVSLAVAWPLYALAIQLSGLDLWLNDLVSSWRLLLEQAYATWPTLQRWAAALLLLQEVLQVTLTAMLLWLGAEYLLLDRRRTVSMR